MTSALNHRYPEVQGELETELEAEDEMELEDEFESEQEWEEEWEDEAFLGALGGIARTVGGLLGGDSEFEAEGEFEFEFEAEAENEAEFENEAEDEAEAFVNPVRRIYPDAELMAHLSRQAAESEDEQESEAFIGALVPLAARLIPRAASLVIQNAPALIRGATRISRELRKGPAGRRRLLQALPVVLQRTAQSLADQASNGRPVTSATAVRTLARVAGRVLGDQHACRSAVHAVGVFDRRYQARRRTSAGRVAAARRAPVPAAPGLAGGPAYTRPQRSAAPRQQRRASSGARRARRNR